MDINKLIRETGSMQKPEELEMLINYLKSKNIESIVEVGIMSGGTTAIFKSYFPDAVVVGVDWCVLEIAQTTQQTYNFSLVNGDSQSEETVKKVLDLLPKRFIDFVFIDADHHYENAKRDFEVWSPYAKIIGLHDIQENTSKEVTYPDGAYTLWKELKEKYQSTEFSIPTGWGGIGLILK